MMMMIIIVVVIVVFVVIIGRRDSAVGIATGYGVYDGEVGVRVPVGARFSLLRSVQTGFGVQPTSCPIGTGTLSPGAKRPEREADHSHPTSAEVKKTWVYTSIPPYDFMT
jgi:hypothetical protein